MLISNSVMFIKPPLSTSCIQKKRKKRKRDKLINVFFPFCIDENGRGLRKGHRGRTKMAAATETLYFKQNWCLSDVKVT